jgi:glycosyltransferase involved in cell wall biosynthesis
VKLAVVVQRYGLEISGGAELLARYLAEHLARHADVEVLTTCARDYITWKNEWPPGEERVNGVNVRRFRVARPRRLPDFGRRSTLVFNHVHSIGDEIAWLDSEGPTSPALIRHLRHVRDRFDFFLFVCARYYPAWHGARAVPDKAVLVPTAEREPAMGLSIFGPVFRGVRAVMYNTAEERALVEAISRNRDVPNTIVGIGSAIPERTQPGRFRRKFGITRPFALYVGRIDENKGCRELFVNFQRYAGRHPHGLDLVLIGRDIIPIPKHPRIRHLGFLPDEDKFDALAASEVLIMPSKFESLSMVALEAWALGTPVLANGHCDVLRGQCIRSGAGLCYMNWMEFVDALFALEAAGPLNALLGRNGPEFFRRNYAWPVIEQKYLDVFDRLKREPARATMAPVPGWAARRRREVPPAREVVNAAPHGPVLR